MAGRTVKCQLCNESVPFSEKETLTQEVKVSDSGKKTTKYWHNECYPKHLAEQEFIKNEIAARDELDRVVKKIYGVSLQLPPQYWSLLNDLRNGTNRFQKFWTKKYKQGVSYEIMKEAYLLSVQSIEWARMSKKFRTLDEELRYGLRIMEGKLNDAHRKIKTREQQDKVNKAMEQVHIDNMRDNREVSFKKKENNDDLSWLLGND